MFRYNLSFICFRFRVLPNKLCFVFLKTFFRKVESSFREREREREMNGTSLFYDDPHGIKVSPWIIQRRKFYADSDWEDMMRKLTTTCTLYVGNLSFFTTEEQLYVYISTQFFLPLIINLSNVSYLLLTSQFVLFFLTCVIMPSYIM